MKKDPTTFAVAGWHLKTLPEYDAILLSFACLPDATQAMEKAVTDRQYILDKPRARELAQRIIAILDSEE